MIIHLKQSVWLSMCLLLLMGKLTVQSYASAIMASSGTSPDIQIAIDQATPGDSVLIPAGKWDFNEPVTLRGGIHIQGEGKDRTILRRTTAVSDPFFVIEGEGNTSFEFSEMTLQGIGTERYRSGDLSILDSGIKILGQVVDFEIYDCRFIGFSVAGVAILSYSGNHPGHSRGVIYHNEFIDNYYVSSTFSNGYGVWVRGDDSDWTLQLGTENAVFIEDNYFRGCRHCVSANAAARYVFRYNTVEDNIYPYAAVDAHGQQFAKRGTRSFEIYGNTITGGVEWDSGNSRPTWAIGIRGGDGVIFDNHFLKMPRPVLLVIEGYTEGINDAYPIPDQTTDLYLWNNRLDGVANSDVALGWTDEMEAEMGVYLKEDRDFYFIKKPAYQPYVYPHPLRSRLVGRWDFNGNLNDVSGYRHQGTETGILHYEPGHTGEAVDLNGLDASVRIPDSNALSINGDLTIAAWIYPRDITSGRQTIVSKDPRYEYSLMVEPSGNISFQHGNGEDEEILTTEGISLPMSTWSHVAVVRATDTKKVYFYFDGIKIGEQSYHLFPTTSSNPMMIGGDNQNFFNGLIDELLFYQRSLDASEISELTGLQEAILENAEDGTTSRWDICDDLPSGAWINNVYDKESNSRVIQLQGSGQDNAFQLKSFMQNPWNKADRTYLKFDVKGKEPFIFYIELSTSEGTERLAYSSAAHEEGDPEPVIQCELDPNIIDGHWHYIVCGLEKDLNEVKPKAVIQAVDTLWVRGSLCIDNISLY